MPTFHNPYHFVPLGPGAPPEPVPLDEFADTKPGVPAKQRHHPKITHDRFVDGSHSGRLVCKVTVETPLICGNIQEDNESPTKRDGTPNPRHHWTKLLKPFELGGEPALPGSALRGMLSALAEAASHSAMRTLDNRRMSYRRQVSEGLSAIGMIVQKGGQLHLLPLAEPHFDLETRTPLPNDTRASYAVMFPNPRAKIYFGERHTVGIPAFLNAYKSNANPTGGPFYAVHKDWLVDKVKRDRFWLGESITPAQPEHKIRPWEELSEQDRSSGNWIRGILRVLGKYPERSENLPTKKHEYFLRFSPQEEADLVAQAAAVFPVESEAVTRFNQLADERAEAENTSGTDPKKLLPFTPHGTPRVRPTESNRPNSSWQLKAGDIVFFRPSEDGKRVVEISLSSAWRGRVEQNSPQLSPAAPLWAFLHPNLVPLSTGRTALTLAEQLFGAVKQRQKKSEAEEDAESSFALAGRVRFSHARLHSHPPQGAWQSAEELLSQPQMARITGEVSDIPLKNLASPKPPSPSLYFKQTNGRVGYIPKKMLNPVAHTIQGRKFYLRRDSATYNAGKEAFVHEGQLGTNQERNSIVRQHQSIEKFVRKDTTFFFHLDFDNLSDLELQLLNYVLQPAPGFRHQVGHGKPLGLGQVKIEIAGLLEINRRERYRRGLTVSRWHQAWVGGDPNTEWPKKLQRYLPMKFSPLPEKLGELKSSFEAWASRNKLEPVLRALELLGNPVPHQSRVHYPQTTEVNRGEPIMVPIPEGSAEFEREHYRWFVQNDQQRQPGQFLRPLTDANTCGFTEIPTLERAPSASPPAPSRPKSGASPGLSTASATSKASAKAAVEAVAAPAAKPVAPVPSDLINTKQRFTVTEGKNKKDGTKQPLGLKFVWNNETYSAGMDFNLLVKKGLKPADTVELRITGYNPGTKSFNVSDT